MAIGDPGDRLHGLDTGRGHGLQAGPSSQAAILRGLPRGVGPGLSWILPNPEARRATNRLYQESAAGLCRAEAHQQYHVQYWAYPQPGDDHRIGHELSRPRSKAAWGRTQGAAGRGKENL